jgi:SAM-dependent methyltransferase
MASTQHTADLQAAIAQFPRWHYRFEFDDGVTTPIFDERHVNRHEQRRAYFFDALLSIVGGGLNGRRVLDLGCNAGYWSLQALNAGADFVLGVDGRQMHIDQADLVFAAKDIEPGRYRFEFGNIFEHDLKERFDVVFCLGLMYHIAKPMELFELMARVGAEILVIDTEISPLPGSYFRVRHGEPLEEPRNAVDYETVLVPTRQAVVDLARQFGFHTAILAPNFTDLTGMPDYGEGRRRAFICSKTTPLDGLTMENPRTPRLLWAAARGELWEYGRALLGRPAPPS